MQYQENSPRPFILLIPLLDYQNLHITLFGTLLSQSHSRTAKAAVGLAWLCSDESLDTCEANPTILYSTSLFIASYGNLPAIIQNLVPLQVKLPGGGRRQC